MLDMKTSSRLRDEIDRLVLDKDQVHLGSAMVCGFKGCDGLK